MPKHFTTERLRIVSARPEFAAACADYALRNREHHRPWSPSRGPEFFTPSDWEQRLSLAARAFEDGTAYSFIILDPADDSRVIGEINYSNVIRGVFHACFLGYNLDERVLRLGYMHEAISATLDFIFGEAQLHRVMANYMPSNERSAAVLQRLGFHVEGFARDYLFLDGAWRDHVLTALYRTR